MIRKATKQRITSANRLIKLVVEKFKDNVDKVLCGELNYRTRDGRELNFRDKTEKYPHQRRKKEEDYDIM